MRLLGCFLLLLTGWSSLAQPGRLSFGLRAGVGLAGSSRFVQLDRETSDQYSRGLALSAGLQLRYRLTSQLSLVAGADMQRLNDGRSRVFTYVEQFTTVYKNQLTQIQTPIYLQWKPLVALKGVYLMAGVGPRFLLNGATQFTTLSTRTGPLPSGSLPIPLDLATNRHWRTDWRLIGGAGLSISSKLAIEITYQFAKPIAYATFDPGNTFINPPVYSTRASQGWLLTTTYWFP